MVQEGELFILLPRLFGTGLEERFQEDPSVRICIDGRIYSGRVTLVSECLTLGALLGLLLRRTMSVEVAGVARPVLGGGGLESGGIAVYRLESMSRGSATM